MKNVYIAILLISSVLFGSCLKDENSLFDETASIRMEQSLKNYKEILSSSENGWLLEYYPEENQSYGGYSYVLKFSASSVQAHFELAGVEDSAESLYQLIADDGPVLSFDTYNTFLHVFAEPSSNMPDGFQGDYEFILMGISSDQNEITLKGKKTGNYMSLKRMTESPEEYLSKLAEVKSLMDTKNYKMSIGGVQADCVISNRIFAYQYVGTDEAVESGEIAYSYTSSGIRLYKPIEINGISAREFIIKNETLVSTDGKVTITFVYPPINEFFITSTSQYLVCDLANNIMDMSDKMKEWANLAYSSNVDQWDESLQSIYIKYDSVEKKQAFTFASKASNGTYSSNFYYTATAVEGTENKVAFGSTYTMDTNATYYPYFGEMLTNILSLGIYTLEADGVKNFTTIKFISDSDPEVWFVIALVE